MAESNRFEIHIGLRCTVSFLLNVPWEQAELRMMFEDVVVPGLADLQIGALSYFGPDKDSLAIAVFEVSDGVEPPVDLLNYLVDQGVRVSLVGSKFPSPVDYSAKRHPERVAAEDAALEGRAEDARHEREMRRREARRAATSALFNECMAWAPKTWTEEQRDHTRRLLSRLDRRDVHRLHRLLPEYDFVRLLCAIHDFRTDEDLLSKEWLARRGIERRGSVMDDIPTGSL